MGQATTITVHVPLNIQRRGGRYASVRELAEKERLKLSDAADVFRVTLRPPAIVEAILAGRQAEGLTLAVLIGVLPVEWRAQEQTLPRD